LFFWGLNRYIFKTKSFRNYYNKHKLHFFFAVQDKIKKKIMWKRVGSPSLDRFLIGYTRSTLRDACSQTKVPNGVQPELVVWLCRLRKCEMLSEEAVDGLCASNRLRSKRSMCGLLLKDIFGLDAQQYDCVKNDLENAITGNSGLYQAKHAAHEFALVLKLPDEVSQNKKMVGAGIAILAALASGAVVCLKMPSEELSQLRLENATLHAELERWRGSDLGLELAKLNEDRAALHQQVHQLQDRYESGFRHEVVHGEIGDMSSVRGEIILNAAVRPKVRIRLKDCQLAPNLVIVVQRGELIGDVLWAHIYANPSLMRTVASIRIVSSDGEALPADAVDEDVLFARSFLYIQADVTFDALYINMQHRKRVQEISRSTDLRTFTIRQLFVYTEHHLDVEWFVHRADEVSTLLKSSIDTVPGYIVAKGTTTVLYGSDFTMDKLRADVLHHPDIVDKLQFLHVPHTPEHEQLISTEFPTLQTKIKFYTLP